jgi:hypothetical protein
MALLENLALDLFPLSGEISSVIMIKFNKLSPHERVLLEQEITFLSRSRYEIHGWLKKDVDHRSIFPQLKAKVEKQFPILRQVALKSKELRRIERHPVVESYEERHSFYYSYRRICFIDPYTIFSGDEIIDVDEDDKPILPFSQVKVTREISLSPPPGSVLGFKRKRTVEMSLLDSYRYDSAKRTREEKSIPLGFRKHRSFDPPAMQAREISDGFETHLVMEDGDSLWF